MPANRLRDLNLRQAAFPFDWMLSVDDSGLVELIDRNFQDFINDEYLIRSSITGDLMHSLYHIEFLYDHEAGKAFSEDEFQHELAKMREKYTRRIARLQQIENFEGKVFFIRFLLPSRLYKKNYPDSFWFDYSHEKNEKDVAIELRDALKRRYPHLNFELILVSKTDMQEKMEMIEDVPLYFLLDEFNLQSWKEIFDHLKGRS